MSEERLAREERDGVQCWRLVRGRGNALDPGTLETLIEAFESSRGDPRPIILGAEGPSFCTGLDLTESEGASRKEMARLMDLFHRAMVACFSHPAPVIAAIGGHALAGGALLAFACDRRVIARGDFRFGVHGIRLGVSYPQVAIEVLRHQFLRATTETLIYGGRLFSPREAWEMGLVDRMVAPTELEEAAVAEAAWCLGADSEAVDAGFEGFAVDPTPFVALKQTIRAPAYSRIQEHDPRGAERWLDQWFLPQTQQRLAGAREALRGRGGDKPAAKG